MRILLAAALLVPLVAPARAQDEPTTTAVAVDPAVQEVRDKIVNEPDMAEAVARRVMKSRLITMLTSDPNPDVQLQAAQDWVKKDPDSAARVAMGLASDDRNGTTTYEDSLLRVIGPGFEKNPGAVNNLYYKLKDASRNSKLLKKQSEGMSADEQREILRTLFEGQGAQSDKVVTQGDPRAGYAKPAAFASGGLAGYYDRLSAGNLRGYSPQLMALQSQLNARRPPGAPALVETGKLDYQTLSYPAYGMDYDVRSLEGRIRSDRILALARATNTRLTARDWRDPAALEAALAAKAAAAKLSPRFARRAELAGKARDAMSAFLAAAEKAKDPSKISKGLLMELGRDQKEAARWITAAALEEVLARNEELEGFLSPELLSLIDAAPASAPTREAYKKRGEALKSTVARVKANAQKAQDLLTSDAWAASLAEVDRLNGENAGLNRTLARDVGDYARVPFRIAEARVVQPRWRDYLDDLAVKWVPSSGYAQGVAARRARLSRYLDVFATIASGDLDAAHRALAAVEPVSR